ncbi:putative molybdopterin molybdenumtransferase MoeA [Paratrimastix pyriformis]|uniref:molybdopterin adenylyltransferase n=1 Tax=Paratrimastix pyriformis TaxID=342808 RepID=A0ABQ8UWJ5_9EUKA|nr:putative molybdopterin molybdenumtransferase MoeA [Paratrimastix pyriformis]
MEEIDSGEGYIGWTEALQLIGTTITPNPAVVTNLEGAVGQVASEDLTSKLSCPDHATSLKDGYAVVSDDIVEASSDRPVSLRCIGEAFAGVPFSGSIPSGSCVHITAGAYIPDGANAVCAGEFCSPLATAGTVSIRANARPGRNILPVGGDVTRGELLVRRGERITAPHLAVLAAGGFTEVPVYRPSAVMIIAIGTEIAALGDRLLPGQLYASNLAQCMGWLRQYGLPVRTRVVPDDGPAIQGVLAEALRSDIDFIITSGGAWGSLRDLVLANLGQIGWRQIFYRLRMGPGKGTAFGVATRPMGEPLPSGCRPEVPVMCLPGGPPSNEMAFLQLALPAIMRQSGLCTRLFPEIRAVLTEPLQGRGRDWTQFFRVSLASGPDGVLLATPSTAVGVGSGSAPRRGQRLTEMAKSLALARLPEGVEFLDKGCAVTVQILSAQALASPRGPA